SSGQSHRRTDRQYAWPVRRAQSVMQERMSSGVVPSPSRPKVPRAGTPACWTAPSAGGLTVTEDPSQTRTNGPDPPARNRDPPEAESGPLVASGLDYLALEPTSSVHEAPVAGHAIGQRTRIPAPICALRPISAARMGWWVGTASWMSWCSALLVSSGGWWRNIWPVMRRVVSGSGLQGGPPSGLRMCGHG